MKKQLLCDLSGQQLLDLFKKNEWLRKQASEQAQADAESLVSDYLAPFKNVRSLEYEFGCYKVFRVKYQECYSDFLDALEKCNKDFCIICDDETQEIFNRAKEKIEFFDLFLEGYEEISDKRWNNLKNWMDNNIKALCDYLWDYIDSEYCYSFTDDAAENALECLIDNIGANYETDGTFIYEIAVRQYA